MEVVVPPTNPADTAVLTVELLPVQFVIEEIALEAAVRAERDPTAGAVVSHGLAGVAQGAHDLCHSLAVKDVAL